MIRRSVILLLEIAAGALALFLIVGAVVAVRLSTGEPLRLTALTPYLEQALSAPDGSPTVRIGETRLTWAGWKRNVDLVAVNVRIGDQERRTLATVPEMTIALSFRAFLRGLVAPTRIELLAPRALLIRRADGTVQLDLREQPEAETEEASILPVILEELAHPPRRDRASGYLRHISVVGARVTLIDRRLGVSWQVPSADMDVRRSARGIEGSISAVVEQGDRLARLHAEFTLATGSDRVQIAANFADIDPPTLANLPALAELARLAMTIRGAVTAEVGLDGKVGDVRFDLHAGPGKISAPEFYAEPLPVERILVRGRLSAGADRLDIAEATLDLSGPAITAEGAVTGLAAAGTADLMVEANLLATAVPSEALMRYWPAGLGRGARNWISKNIAGGAAERGTLSLQLRLPGGNPDAAVIEKADGRFTAAGLTVTYLPGLPPLTDVAGEGHFVGDSIEISVAKGHVGNLVVQGGTVVVTGLEASDQIIALDGVVAGPVREALELLDRDRLGYPRKLGLDPSRSGGEALSRLRFRFPGEGDLALDDVEFQVDTKVTGGSVADAVLGADVTDADLTISTDAKGLTATGAIKVAGEPATVEWREEFGQAKVDTRIALAATTTTEQRAALGFDFRPWIDGPLPINLVYTRSKTRGSVVVAANLGKARLEAEPIGWAKAIDVPGSASLKVELIDNRPVAIEDIDVEAGDLAARGRVELDPAGKKPLRLEFSRAAWGHTDLNGVTAEIGEEIMVSVDGGIFDAEPLLTDDGAKKTEADADADAEKVKKRGRPFRAVAPRLEKVLTKEGREITNLALDLAHDGDRWRRAIVSGGLPGGKSVSLNFAPDAEGRQRLDFATDDAGALLRALDVLDTVVGGQLTISGKSKTPDGPLKADADMRSYRLVRARTMAKLLKEARFDEINTLLGGEGIPFDRFTGKFTYDGDVIEVERARAYGAALGITAKGRIDFAADKVDIEGTIVPAYLVNRLVGEIPLIGPLIAGGKGEGLFAATYKARGPIDDPSISVNPLAALAPGFLRGIFNMFDGGGEEGSEDFTPLPQPSQK